MNNIKPVTDKCPMCGSGLINGDTDIVCRNVECNYRILKSHEHFVSTITGAYPKEYNIQHSCPNCGHFIKIDIKLE